MTTFLASIATILDFGLALYIFVSDRPKPTHEFSGSSEYLSRSPMSSGKRMLIIAINGLIVGGTISLLLLYGITRGLADIFLAFLLPLVFNFALGYTSLSQRAASNRAILSCFFMMVGLILPFGVVTTDFVELIDMLLQIWPQTVVVLFLAWAVSLLAYRMRKNPPDF